MNFDTFSTAALAAELRPILSGGRVQRVTQINSLTLAFEIFVYPLRHYLILSAEPQTPRMYLTMQKSRRGVGNETPLMLVLRKYMRGAIVKAIDQPPYERILHFYFDSRVGSTILVAEMLGTRSNLILLEADQTILGVARLSKQQSRRQLFPGHFYEPPPPQNKLAPDDVTEYALRQELNEASPKMKLARLLPQVISGVSPLLAREIVYRASGSVDTKVAQVTTLTPILTAFEKLFDHFWNDEWQPTLAFDDDDIPVAFAAFPLQHLTKTRPVETFSEAVETFFADAAANYVAAKTPLIEVIKDARQKLTRRRERLTEDAAAQANPVALKEQGEAILAYAHQTQPGQTELIIDWLPGEPAAGSATIIKLDPSLSASENAQQYFSRYRKAQRAAEEIPAQLKKISFEEHYLEQLEQDLAMAEDRPEIDTIAEALVEAGYYRPKRKRKRQKSTAGHYLRLTAPGGATVWVGKNAFQNAHLTFNRAKPDDLWLHARDVPGAHVIIPTAEGLPSEADVFWAARVAAYYSRARHDTSVEVDVTLKKHVRAIKGAAPGLVTYRHESTLPVAPEAPDTDGP
jgi:predicted ribosome quality control (RQC) complex YloA/Tae2 family protein